MDIQINQIIFQIINFSVVVGALTYFLYKPVLKIFEERSNRIAEGQKAAEEALKSRDEIEIEKKKMANTLKKERATILNAAQDDAKKKAQAITAKAKTDSKAEHAKLIAGWESEKAQLMKAAKADITDAVIAVSAKLINQSLDNKAQLKMIDTELTSILKNI